MGSDGSSRCCCFSFCFCFELGLGEPDVGWIRTYVCEADEEGGGLSGNDGCRGNVVGVGVEVEVDGTGYEDSI